MMRWGSLRRAKFPANEVTKKGGLLYNEREIEKRGLLGSRRATPGAIFTGEGESPDHVFRLRKVFFQAVCGTKTRFLGGQAVEMAHRLVSGLEGLPEESG
jgi:hypothetical protein